MHRRFGTVCWHERPRPAAAAFREHGDDQAVVQRSSTARPSPPPSHARAGVSRRAQPTVSSCSSRCPTPQQSMHRNRSAGVPRDSALGQRHDSHGLRFCRTALIGRSRVCGQCPGWLQIRTYGDRVANPPRRSSTLRAISTSLEKEARPSAGAFRGQGRRDRLPDHGGVRQQGAVEQARPCALDRRIRARLV